MKMIENPKVCVVVVTYNRIALLKECLEALRSQTYNNYDILVVNNGSTDGTKEYLDSQKDTIVINQENLGGAGGFYAGQKYGYDNGYDAVLLMDDDGIPAPDQIENLVCYSRKYNVDYANALAISKDNGQVLNISKDVYSKEKYDAIEFIPNKMAPFNGTFIWRHVIERIGFIKKEMFIWGDEREYTHRVNANGFKWGTLTKAIHHHPSFKYEKRRIIPFINKGVAFKAKGRDRIYYRNLGYIDSTYGTNSIWKYILYYMSRLDFSSIRYMYKYYNEGRSNDFSKNYMQ